MRHYWSVRRNEKVEACKLWPSLKVTQEKDENSAVFLSLVTEAFRMYTNIDHESTEGRLLLAVHFII